MLKIQVVKKIVVISSPLMPIIGFLRIEFSDANIAASWRVPLLNFLLYGTIALVGLGISIIIFEKTKEKDK